MKAHVVLAHPEPGSFNGRLAATTRSTLADKGWEVTLTDLYAENFDPREGPAHYPERADAAQFHAQTEQRHHAEHGGTPPEVAAEGERLLQSDLLVVHFPLWWFGMPGMLKGWIDRVFVYGALYRGAMRYDTGICRGKRMLACITTGASADSCAHDGREGDSRLHAWPLLFPFRYIGYDVLEPAFFHGIGGVASIEVGDEGADSLAPLLEQWSAALGEIDARRITPFNADGDFDERKRLLPEAPEYSPFIAHRSSSPWD